MHSIKAFLFYTVIAIVCFDPCENAAAAKPPPFVSAIALVATPREYDGMEITASGWLYLQIEDGQAVNAWLFPSPDHLRVSDFPSSIILDVEPLVAALKRKYPSIPVSRMHGAYIVVTGTFSATHPKAPGNLGCGEIDDVVNVSQLADVQPDKPK